MSEPRAVCMEMEPLETILEREQLQQLHTRLNNASRTTQRLHEQVEEFRRQCFQQQQFYCPSTAGTEIAQAAQECDLL